MSYLDRTWQGNDLTTTWGSSRRSLNVTLAIENPVSPGARIGLPVTRGSLKNGTRGTSCGQDFTVQNGQFDYDTSPATIHFDMQFDGHPPEVFSGTLHGSTPGGITSISGTIHVKPSWLVGKPATTQNLYSRYRAYVTLT